MDIQLLYNLVVLMVLRGTKAEVHEHKISDAEHFNKDGKHDTTYDHDAFLGKGHGHDFDGLEPKEAKRRLREMLKKVRRAKTARRKVSTFKGLRNRRSRECTKM